MSVYFVYRCHYGAPSEKHVRRFEHDTVLDWAKAVFKQFDTDGAAYRYAEDLLDRLSVYSFGSMFFAKSGYPPRTRPETMADVHDWFQAMYDPTPANGPHHVQIMTDDDELDMAVYVFDDHYRAANPGKADFLLLDGWELPGGAASGSAGDFGTIRTERATPAGGSDGFLYATDLSPGPENLREKNACDYVTRIDGLRVPELARYLLTTAEADDQAHSLCELRDNLVRALANPTGEDAGFLAAIRDRPDEQTNWDAYSDWLQERGRPAAGSHLLALALASETFSGAGRNRNWAFDRATVTPHMAQLCKHRGRWRGEMTVEITDRDTFAQFIFFDDRWAAAHPTLAAGVLTFASRWDVLT
jgi:uncharacterized protein (TIGR02996 family)